MSPNGDANTADAQNIEKKRGVCSQRSENIAALPPRVCSQRSENIARQACRIEPKAK